jgi:hypothetical protein
VKAVGFFRSQTGRLLAAILVVLALGIATFRSSLGLGLIGPDSYAILVASQAESVRDVVSNLTQPLMAGRNTLVNFYRPVSQAFYLAAYALFGTHPLGYQCMNLLVHLLCAIAVVLLARIWTDRIAIGLLAGTIFVVHPATIQVVPFLPRIQDVLATLFGLGALLAHERVLRRATLCRWLVAGLLAALSFLTKETGLLFSGLLGLSHLLRASGPYLVRFAQVSNALLATVLPALVLRFVVLSQAGGYALELLQLPLWLFLRQLLYFLFDPYGAFGPTTALWAALSVPLGLCFVVHRRIALLLATWLGVLTGLYVYLGFFRPQPIVLSEWYIYPALPPVAIALAAIIVEGARRGQRWILRLTAAGADSLPGDRDHLQTPAGVLRLP